jgi:hypothetical protein
MTEKKIVAFCGVGFFLALAIGLPLAMHMEETSTSVGHPVTAAEVAQAQVSQASNDKAILAFRTTKHVIFTPYCKGLMHKFVLALAVDEETAAGEVSAQFIEQNCGSYLDLIEATK